MGQNHKTQTVTSKLLTIPEASERLGLKPATVRFWVWTRKIEHVKVGRSVRIRADTVERVIEQGTVPAQREAPVY